MIIWREMAYVSTYVYLLSIFNISRLDFSSWPCSLKPTRFSLSSDFSSISSHLELLRNASLASNVLTRSLTCESVGSQQLVWPIRKGWQQGTGEGLDEVYFILPYGWNSICGWVPVWVMLNWRVKATRLVYRYPPTCSPSTLIIPRLSRHSAHSVFTYFIIENRCSSVYTFILWFQLWRTVGLIIDATHFKSQ